MLILWTWQAFSLTNAINSSTYHTESLGLINIRSIERARSQIVLSGEGENMHFVLLLCNIAINPVFRFQIIFSH